MDLEISPSLTIPAAELHWRFARSSGPGGQHVNTTDSRAELMWNVTGSAALTDEQRSLLLKRLGAKTRRRYHHCDRIRGTIPAA